MSDPRSTIPRPTTTNMAALGLIAGLLTQSAAIVWWGASIDQRVSAIEQKVKDSSHVAETLARMDERTTALMTTVNRIDARINAQDDAALAARRR